MSTRFKIAFGMAIVGMVLLYVFGILGDHIDNDVIGNIVLYVVLFGLFVEVASVVVAGPGWMLRFLGGAIKWGFWVIPIIPINLVVTIYLAGIIFCFMLLAVCFVPIIPVFISYWQSR